jgi:hypothetical protein
LRNSGTALPSESHIKASHGVVLARRMAGKIGVVLGSWIEQIKVEFDDAFAISHKYVLQNIIDYYYRLS